MIDPMERVWPGMYFTVRLDEATVSFKPDYIKSYCYNRDDTLQLDFGAGPVRIRCGDNRLLKGLRGQSDLYQTGMCTIINQGQVSYQNGVVYPPSVLPTMESPCDLKAFQTVLAYQSRELEAALNGKAALQWNLTTVTEQLRNCRLENTEAVTLARTLKNESALLRKENQELRARLAHEDDLVEDW